MVVRDVAMGAQAGGQELGCIRTALMRRSFHLSEVSHDRFLSPNGPPGPTCFHVD